MWLVMTVIRNQMSLLSEHSFNLQVCTAGFFVWCEENVMNKDIYVFSSLSSLLLLFFSQSLL